MPPRFRTLRKRPSRTGREQTRTEFLACQGLFSTSLLACRRTLQRSPAARLRRPGIRIASRRLGHAGAEPRQRFLDLALARFRGLAALALLVDDLLRRSREEIGVRELGVDLVDIGSELAALLVEARGLGAEVDDALERQRRDFAAHDELHRAARSALGDGDCGEARETP